MSTSSVVSCDVLAFARAQQEAAEVAGRELIRAATEFAALHSVDPESAEFGEQLVELAGPGAPAVGEFAAMEFAANLGWSTDAGRAFLAEAIELRHRLPRLWARLLAGKVSPTKARKVAGHTISLGAEAAGYVDAQIAAYAHRVGPAQLDRLCEEARDRFDPDQAEARRAERSEQRCVRIMIGDHAAGDDAVGVTGGDGLASVEAWLDAADALDLEHAVADHAHALLAGGSAESLDVRRAQALGEIARGHQALALEAATTLTTCADSDAEPAVQPDAVEGVGRRVRPVRRTELVVHLSDATLGTGLVTCPELKTHLTIEQVLDWLTSVDTEVIVQPVIDLDADTRSRGYVPSQRLRRQVLLAEPTCVFPHCRRDSAKSDLDHIVAYDSGGPTSFDNLAPLCRRHHRAKTFGGWTYDRISRGHYLWRSPTGLLFDRTPTGVERVLIPDRPPTHATG